ncbi:hypothetical protein [Solimicrobium silvestre]|uniref:Uncharacterized protein n=1 Tax=Solimicrobium silvestre TaxID=2099400 RepID=A0A2S9H3N1_9BURK|nr:hypothetical protein [Solimicrobium silvestre]PRC94543.1 hypothetical protein S2091_0546 [Solimicrobium silvestre]
MRNNRNFCNRSENEQIWMMKNTWCDKCNAADFGLKDPIEYEENGKIIVEGKCSICSSIVLNEVLVEN